MYYIVGVQSAHGSGGPNHVEELPTNDEGKNSIAAGQALVDIILQARSEKS